MNLAAYLRVSTQGQAEEGLGLVVQERSIRRWCKANGHKVVAWCRDEGVSGSLPAEQRPGLTEALRHVREGVADGVVFARLDRLARALNVQEASLALVWRYGGRAFSADSGEVEQDDRSDPMRTAIRQMMGVFAQLERATISARMRGARDVRHAQGQYAGFGSPPFGFQSERSSDGARLVPKDDEQEALDLIRSMVKGGKSLREIGSALTEAGHKPKRSAVWHPESLRRIVARL